MARSSLLRSLLALLAAITLAPAPAHADRVRDLGAFQGVRTNQLTGYGIVVGLPGTGDDNLEYITPAMRGVSGRLCLKLPQGCLLFPSYPSYDSKRLSLRGLLVCKNNDDLDYVNTI